MNATLSPAKASYLARVAAGLADLPEEDRDEVLAELEAHLAELEDPELESVLGTPDEFVAEFRVSAGLSTEAGETSWARLRLLGERWQETKAQIAELTRWHSFRPAWVWIRGWLVVVVWSFVSGYEQFRYFPIPSIGSSSLTGLFLVTLATALSVWLDRGRGEWSRRGTKAFSVVAAWGLVIGFANTPVTGSYVEVPWVPDQLVGPDGEPIQNIYAYDLDGDPVEVVLFDERGRPLRSLPQWVYEQVDHDPGQEYYETGYGLVRFPRDEFGRIIPNLYPLQISTYDQFGRLQPLPPPSLGFPSLDETRNPTGEPVPTTIVTAR